RCLSDWSSDVCSSDLSDYQKRSHHAPTQSAAEPSPSRKSASPDYSCTRADSPPHTTTPAPSPPDPAAATAPAASKNAPEIPPSKIGRASCREREKMHV